MSRLQSCFLVPHFVLLYTCKQLAHLLVASAKQYSVSRLGRPTPLVASLCSVLAHSKQQTVSAKGKAFFWYE
ncbi:hypothetical protein IWZ03DRAFT_56554 [Phyllosticta citriasiana]|uniref:Secreted protein n=1 Tax=Phyllosticta citriasiana TaxID=595635 RepID=A0ABR1KET2_9PEZI